MKTVLTLASVLIVSTLFGGWCEKHKGNTRMYCLACFESDGDVTTFDDLPNRFKGEALERLVDVVLMCESHTYKFENDVIETIGDNGKAVGPAQMWKTQVDECNRIIKKMYKTTDNTWKYDDRKSVLCTRSMIRVFLQHRALTWYQQLGEYPTNDRLVATWHRPKINAQKEWYMAKARKCILLRSQDIEVLDKFDREPWAYTYTKNGKQYKDYR